MVWTGAELQFHDKFTRDLKDFAAKLNLLDIRGMTLLRGHFYRMLLGLPMPNLEALALYTLGVSADTDLLDSHIREIPKNIGYIMGDLPQDTDCEGADSVEGIIYKRDENLQRTELLGFDELCEVVWQKRDMLAMPKLNRLEGAASVIIPYLLLAPALENMHIEFDINMSSSWETYTSLYSRINVTTIKHLQIDFNNVDLYLSRFLASMHNLETFHWRSGQSEIADSDIRDCFTERSEPWNHLRSITIEDSLRHDKRFAVLSESLDDDFGEDEDGEDSVLEENDDATDDDDVEEEMNNHHNENNHAVSVITTPAMSPMEQLHLLLRTLLLRESV